MPAVFFRGRGVRTGLVVLSSFRVAASAGLINGKQPGIRPLENVLDAKTWIPSRSDNRIGLRHALMPSDLTMYSSWTTEEYLKDAL